MRSRHAALTTALDLMPDLVPALTAGRSPATWDGVPELTSRDRGELLDLLTDTTRFDGYADALARVGNCAHPIRLRGHSDTIDTATGEVVDSYASDTAPLGVTHVRCGNRRATVCPSCSRLYAADMFHLIRAGVVGGKTVPASVGENPLVFATLTAPSFGAVHGRRDTGTRCHPHTRGSIRCAHGRPATCHTAHPDGDPLLGQPLCPECYDYASQVVWQWWAPDLWRRFTIALRRALAHTLGIPADRLGEVATVQYAKVAEYQLRGVVHFHALIRLDGPRTADGFAPAPDSVDGPRLAALVRATTAVVRLRVPGVDDHDPARVLAFGRQLDARPVRTARRTDDPDRALSRSRSPATWRSTPPSPPPTPASPTNPHHQAIRDTVRQLATRAHRHAEATGAGSPYQLLGKWAHMLGFRGHFASKSRRYSVTLGALRRARRRAQALIAEARSAGRPLDLTALEADLLADDHDETTLVVGSWQYLGTGWATEAERILALAAAARAREYDQEHAALARQQREKGRDR